MPLKAGPHVIAAAFLERSDAPNPTAAAAVHPQLDRHARHDRAIRTSIRSRVTGPFNATGPGDTPSRRQIFICRPADARPTKMRARAASSRRCARRAYRGDVEPTSTSQRLFDVLPERAARAGHASSAASRWRCSGCWPARSSASASSAIRRALAPGTVVSRQRSRARLAPVVLPVEQHPGRSAARCRARRARCTRRRCSKQQVRRMLADPKAEALVDELRRPVALPAQPEEPAAELATSSPTSTTTCGRRFERETELFFESIVREDRNVLDLMTADYTFLNERLAQHYGIPNVYGSHFRRVTLTDDARQGPARQGRDPDGDVARRSHLAGRARQVGARQPAQRAACRRCRTTCRRSTKIANRGGKVLTMRERMEEHRKNPVCAQCHKIMDPIGLSMENFDAVGAWRTRDGDGTARAAPIDAHGRAARRHQGRRRGHAAAGAAAPAGAVRRHGHREADDLRARPRPAATTTCRRSARSCATRRRPDYRFSSIVMGIVNSTPFQKRVTLDEGRAVLNR